MEARAQSSLFRILPVAPAALILTLVAVAAATSGMVRGREAGGCEPQTWQDWHVAVKSQCVTRTYVCHHMTTPQLLRDPRVADAYEDALASNDRERIAEMDGLVGQIRSAYGCGRAHDRLPKGAPSGGLPSGHPPIRGPGWTDRALGLDRSI